MEKLLIIKYLEMDISSLDFLKDTIAIFQLTLNKLKMKSNHREYSMLLLRHLLSIIYFIN